MLAETRVRTGSRGAPCAGACWVVPAIGVSSVGGSAFRITVVTADTSGARGSSEVVVGVLGHVVVVAVVLPLPLVDCGVERAVAVGVGPQRGLQVAVLRQRRRQRHH